MASDGKYVVPWKRCAVCPPDARPGGFVFKSPREFCSHLRDFHCTKEGGSFVCRYGMNRVCPSLPLEGVSDRDYEDHVARDHVSREPGVRPTNPSGSPDSSGCSTPVSQEPSIVQDQHKWTIFMSKTNLPAALNDPRLVRRETDFFTKTWGEGFDNYGVMPNPDIPEITKEHFRRYLKRISKRLKDHESSSAAVSDLPAPRPDQKTSLRPEDHFPMLMSRKIDKLSPDYEAIPKIFMQHGFSLDNPATFNTVFPWSLVEPPKQEQAGKPRQSSKLLQEKLSHYLDVVEVHIARQISLRSEAFFLAVSSHDKLQENMANTCATIRKLRDRVHKLDDTMAVGPLRVMRMSQARANHLKLLHKLKLMATVHQTQPTLQLLLSTNEFVGALDLIATTQEVLTQELAGIHSFRHLGSQLAEMEKAIDCMMQEDFVRYATIDLNRPLTGGHDILEEEKLVAIVLGMLRQKKYGFIDIYREESYTCLKAMLKQTVIEAVSQSDEVVEESAQGSLADQMRLLSYSTWMQLLQRIFECLLVIIHRVQNVCLVIEELLNAASGTPSTKKDGPQSPTSPIRMSTDIEDLLTKSEGVRVHAMLRELLCQVCDHANDRCVKVMQARLKEGFLERLTSNEFVQLSKSVEKFVSDCEKLCGKRSTSLRSCLQSQASRFINRFHEERKTKLGLILDNERWKQADVPSEFQALVDHITQSGRLIQPTKNLADAGKRPQEYLLVDGQRYAVVGTALLLVKMIVDYCECCEDIPAATPDILSRLIELLKMFNSRTCQLILGAGAVQLVGLRTISTKNLALASRCLQLVIHFLPIVQQHYEERLQGKQANMLKHFDHVLKDYNDHVAELSNKLLFIMDGMLESNLNKWEVRPPMPSAAFRNISKQICKLHEGISELLPPLQIYSLFESIHNNFKLFLRSQLIKSGVTNDGGPQHGLVVQDVTFYVGNLQSLIGLETLDTDMAAIWDKS